MWFDDLLPGLAADGDAGDHRTAANSRPATYPADRQRPHNVIVKFTGDAKFRDPGPQSCVQTPRLC